MRSWTIAYLLGIALYHSIGGSIYQYSLFYFVLFLFFALLASVPKTLRLLSVCALGIIWADIYVVSQRSQVIPSEFESVDLVAKGYLCSIPKNMERLVSFDLCGATVHKPGEEQASLEGLKIKLNWYRYNTYSFKKNRKDDQNSLVPQDHGLAGVQHFLVRLKKPHGLENPYGFSYERWLLRKGFDGKGYVKSLWLTDGAVEGVNRCPNSVLARFHCRLTQYRVSISDYIDSLDGDVDNVSLIKALTIGYRGDIHKSLWELLSNTGTQHLIAISGLHIGLVFVATVLFNSLIVSIISLMLPRQSQSLNKYKALIGVLLGVFAAFSYAALAGFTVSTQRALIMIVVFAVSGLFRASINNVTRLMIAAAVVLTIDPESIFDYGFWLSFSAVWLLFLGLSRNIRANTSALTQRLLATLKAQWVITIGLSPVLLSLGLGISYSSILVNALAIPIVGFVTVPFALLSLLVAPVSGALSMLLMKVADFSLLRYLEYASLFVDFKVVSFDQVTVLNIICVGLMAVFILVFPAWNGFKLWMIAVLLALVGHKAEVVQSDSPEVVVFDVGQGLAFAGVLGGKAIIYDTGPSYSEGSAADRSIIPYLNAKGVTDIELLVVSHGDDDHAGGLESLESSFPVTQLVSGEGLRLKREGSIIDCPTFGSIKTDWYEVSLYSVAHLLVGQKISSNNRSCVMKVVFKGGAPQEDSPQNKSMSFLLTGDLDKKAEALLIKSAATALKANVLVAGHHGSKSSTGRHLLTVASPDVVVFSSGYKSRFNHPHPDTVSRVKSAGAEIFNTATDGAIVFSLQNSGAWEIKRQRVQ